MKRLIREMRNTAMRLACDETHVQIPLKWGTCDWRASTQELSGRLLDGLPFTIQHIARGPLILWLSGESLCNAMPTLTREDRVIILHGKLLHKEADEVTVLQLAVIVHPGEVIMDYLDSRGWTIRDLAIRTSLPLGQLARIIAGARPVTEHVAKALERVLERPANLWLRLQQQYDERERDYARAVAIDQA